MSHCRLTSAKEDNNHNCHLTESEKCALGCLKCMGRIPAISFLAKEKIKQLLFDGFTFVCIWVVFLITTMI